MQMFFHLKSIKSIIGLWEMSRMIETITCDHCHHTFNTDMISVINNTKDQTLKQLVMNGEIFRITCPLCHQRLYHAHSLLYFDSEKKLFLIYSKSQQFFDHMLYIEGQTGLLNDYVVRYVDYTED